MFRVEEIFREVCQVSCEDGLELDAGSVRGEEIRGPDEYDGVRIRLVARLAGARVPFQVDIGFGDVVVPPPELIDYPVLLDSPAPRLRAYPREVVVAEKFQALVGLGIANTRMKDFYDLWYLGRQFEFDGDSLARAIGATFERRRTPIPGDAPLALTADFHEDAAKQTQWRAFLRRGAVTEVAELRSVVDLIRTFLMPPAAAAARDEGFASHWPRGGPWRSGSR